MNFVVFSSSIGFLPIFYAVVWKQCPAGHCFMSILWMVYWANFEQYLGWLFSWFFYFLLAFWSQTKLKRYIQCAGLRAFQSCGRQRATEAFFGWLYEQNLGSYVKNFLANFFEPDKIIMLHSVCAAQSLQILRMAACQWSHWIPEYLVGHCFCPTAYIEVVKESNGSSGTLLSEGTQGSEPHKLDFWSQTKS